MGSKGRPYRTLTIDGFEVLVGRGDEDNDALTFEVAEPHDLWLHVAGGTPGSHVIVRNPERVEVPREVVERAAAAAAWYSKARGAAKCGGPRLPGRRREQAARRARRARAARAVEERARAAGAPGARAGVSRAPARRPPRPQ